MRHTPPKDLAALAEIRADLKALAAKCAAFTARYNEDADNLVHQFAEVAAEMDLEYLEAAELALTRDDRDREARMLEDVAMAEAAWQRGQTAWVRL